MPIIGIFLTFNVFGFYLGTYLGGYLHSLFAATADERAWWILAGPIWVVLAALAILMFLAFFIFLEIVQGNEQASYEENLTATWFYTALLGLWLGRLVDPIYTQGWNFMHWELGGYVLIPLLCIGVTAGILYRHWSDILEEMRQIRAEKYNV